MLRCGGVLLRFHISAPLPHKVSARTSTDYVPGMKAVKEHRQDGVYHSHATEGFSVPRYNNLREVNRHARHFHQRKGDSRKPLENRVRCPWCHTYFDFTYEEYRRDPTLQSAFKHHEESHSPPPGWEPDPRPMTGKGVTQYDARHRFGWMLGEEW